MDLSHRPRSSLNPLLSYRFTAFIDFDFLSEISISQRLAEPKYSGLPQGQEQPTAKAQAWAWASPQEVEAEGGLEAAVRLDVPKWGQVLGVVAVGHKRNRRWIGWLNTPMGALPGP